MRKLGLLVAISLIACTETPDDHLESLSDRTEIQCGEFRSTCLTMDRALAAASCMESALEAGQVARLRTERPTTRGFQDVKILFAADQQIWSFSFSSDIDGWSDTHEIACSGITVTGDVCFEIRASECQL